MKTISLILPTLNNPQSLNLFLKSVYLGKTIEAKIEIIIIDQSDSDEIKNICNMYNNKNNPFIVYKRSNNLGLSFNRNLGLQFATGDIVGFPDNDCTYYPDTLENILNCFLDIEFKDNDAILGQIYDNNNHQPIIKNWPQKKIKVTIFNFYNLSSSIVLFCKKNKMKFNESMGVGTTFGSCEDTDYIYNMLVLKKKLIYCPNVKVWHPEINYNEASLQRVESYASGLGYFISNGITFVKAGLLLGCIFTKAKQALISQRSYRIGYFRNYFKGLMRGLQQKKIN